MTIGVVRGLRVSALAAVMAAAVTGGLRLCLPAVAEAVRLLPHFGREPADRALGVVLGAVMGALLLGALTWLVVAVTVCLAEVLRSPRGTAWTGEPSTTTVLRPRSVRLVVAAVVGVGGVASPHAIADPVRNLAVAVAKAEPQPLPVTRAAAPGRDAPAPVQRLVGLPVPDRRTGGVDGPRPTARLTPTDAATGTASSRAPEVVRVRRGDSLWGMTVGVLAPGTGDPPEPAVVDRGWRLLYAANRVLIGPDPDLIQPGTVLEVPRRPPFVDRDPGAPQ